MTVSASEYVFIDCRALFFFFFFYCVWKICEGWMSETTYQEIDEVGNTKTKH